MNRNGDNGQACLMPALVRRSLESLGPFGTTNFGSLRIAAMMTLMMVALPFGLTKFLKLDVKLRRRPFGNL